MATRLQQELAGEKKPLLILSIPRGGVIIGRQLAQRLKAEHWPLWSKKIPAPGHKELALGAITDDQGIYLNKRLAVETGADEAYLDQAIALCRREIDRQKNNCQIKGRPELLEKTVIITDDGAATGATLLAAARAVWPQKPHKLIIAVPVCPKDTRSLLEKEADAVIVLETPEVFYSVGQFYERFPQVKEAAVKQILRQI